MAPNNDMIDEYSMIAHPPALHDVTTIHQRRDCIDSMGFSSPKKPSAAKERSSNKSRKSDSKSSLQSPNHRQYMDSEFKDHENFKKRARVERKVNLSKEKLDPLRHHESLKNLPFISANYG